MVNICEPFQRDWVLRNTDVAEVWGIGRNMKIHLEGMNMGFGEQWNSKRT